MMMREIVVGSKLFITYLLASLFAGILIAYSFPLRLWGFFIGLYVGIVLSSLALVAKRKFGPFRWLVLTFILWSIPAVVGIVAGIEMLVEAYYYLSSPFAFSIGILFALVLGFFADTGEELSFATFITFLFATLALMYYPALEGVTILELAKNYIVRVGILWGAVLGGVTIAKYIRRLRV